MTISVSRCRRPNICNLLEKSLRSAIFIPADFKFGRDGKMPVILITGTGSYCGEAFEHNFAKLLKTSSFGDPVWLNISRAYVRRISKERRTCRVRHQLHFEYVAREGGNRRLVAGNLSTQWSLKHWPSTPDRVSNFICFPADLHGTINAWGLCPFNGTQPCTPAVWHQTRNSSFIAKLRSNGGEDSRFDRKPNDSWLAVVQSWAKSVGNDSEAELAI
jgi:hypothetical protein